MTDAREIPMNLPETKSRDEWVAARKRPLAEEKEFTHTRDRLNAERRRLPVVQIEKEYVFDGLGSKATLLDLFDGHRQPIVYHFMFDPSWDAGCEGCSLLVDKHRPPHPPARPPAARTRRVRDRCSLGNRQWGIARSKRKETHP